MRDTSAILLDVTDQHMADAVRTEIERTDGVRLTDLHVWRVGPEAHAAIVEIEGDVPSADLRERLTTAAGIAHLSLAVRQPAR